VEGRCACWCRCACWFSHILNLWSVIFLGGGRVIDREPGGSAGPVQDGPGTAVDLLSGEQDICRFDCAQVISLPEVLTEQWSGPRKLDTLIEPYAIADVWARYSSGLRLPSHC
jgi:hypothetical protein